MRTRTFHLNNLPKNVVRVLFPLKISRFLIDEAVSTVGSQRKLAEKIGKGTNKKINQQAISRFRNGNSFIPLWFLLEILEILKNNDIDVSIEGIEGKVIAFRGPRGKAIYNPNFPWKEDERIIRLVFHLMGDGHGGGGISAGRIPNYTNSDKNLIEEFRNDLQFFGQMEIGEYNTHWKKLIREVKFPKVIGHILRNLYGIDFRCFFSRIPQIMFKLPRVLIAEGIRAFMDDEGSIKSTEIHVYSANRPLLKDLNSLIKNQFPEFNTLTDVRLNSNKNGKITYYFAFLAPDILNYKKYIGFQHEEKLDRLNTLIRVKKRGWKKKKKGETRLLILESLLVSPKSAYEIAKDVNITTRTINKYIKGFRDKKYYYPGFLENGLIKPFSKERGVIWSITTRGRNFITGVSS